MNAPRPPVLATWMLRWLGAGLHEEALEGDLFEAWCSGRSNAWYWRQVLIAVSPVRLATEIAVIKLSATVAVFAIFFLAVLLMVTLAVVLAVSEHRWEPLMPILVGLLPGFWILVAAPGRRRSSSEKHNADC